MSTVLSYFFSRRFAADLLAFLAWAANSLLLLPGLLAVSTFHPFDSGGAVLGAVFLLSGAGGLALLLLAGSRGALRAALGLAPAGGGGPLARTGAAGLGALLFSALLLAATHLAWHARFGALGARLKAEGLPSSLKDLGEGPPPAACAYGELEKVLGGLDASFLHSLPPLKTAHRRWDAAMYAASRLPAEHYAPFIEKELLPLLPRFSRFRPVNYSAVSGDPDSLPDFESEKYQQAARLLRLGALTAARAGRAGDAWRHLGGLLDLADLLASDGSLDVKLAALSLRGQAAEAALTALLNAPGAALPAALRARLLELQEEHLVRDGVRHELARRLDFRRAYELPVITGARKMVARGCHGHPDGSREEAVLNLGARLLTLAGAFDAGYYRLAEFMAGAGQDEHASPAGAPEAAGWPLWPYTIAQFERPLYGGFYLKEREVKAWARLALLASALERHRAAAGRYPGSLAALGAQDVPGAYRLDPVSGRALVYAAGPSGRGYSLCAPGPAGDMKDSGGGDFCVRR